MTIGTDGNDDSTIRADGVPAAVWFEVNARVFTERNREWGQPSYGTGLAYALANPTLGAPEVRRRLRESFAGDDIGIALTSLDIVAVVNGLRVSADLTIEVEL